MRKMIEQDACGIGAVVNLKGDPKRSVVAQALEIVEKLEHRAGKDATGTVGDGVGIMIQIPHALFEEELPQLKGQDYAAGMVFFPQNELERKKAQRLFDVMAAKEGMDTILWRKVPVRMELLQSLAKETAPDIWQVFVKKPADVESGLPFERRLYMLRRDYEKCVPDTYVCSLSSRTIVYKGMFLVHQLRRFYPDLEKEACTSAIALVHSRFSTNTAPAWKRAHPNRLICHNGEINTIHGNAARMLAREETMEGDMSGEDFARMLPVISMEGSDSAMLDNVLEFLMINGVPLEKAMMMLIPQPWRKTDLPEKVKDFYHYQSTLMEPWDGPAAVLFSDGVKAGALLDRNGLRPARWCLTKDDTLILSSEAGVVDLPEGEVVKKSRLEPGRMLVADTEKHILYEDDRLKLDVAGRHPYGEWLSLNLRKLKDLKANQRRSFMHSQETRDRLYKVFGYTYEDMKEQILPMARDGKEPTASMGRDVPLAVFSKNHPSLFHYFHQHFAQVTNPPIDSLREDIVTDTTVYLGRQGNLLEEKPENCRMLEIRNPILDQHDLDKIKGLKDPGLKSAEISLLFHRGMPLKDAMNQLYLQADRAVRKGASILILSDRGIDESRMAIPSLLAAAGLDEHLVKTKKRTSVSFIVDSGEPRTVHECACLLGFGAAAICPYLAHECIQEMISMNLLDMDPDKAADSYNKAILSGIVKTAAKMGISTLQSYQGAVIFEAVGLGKELMDEYFSNALSSVGGIGLKEIEEDVLWRHSRAFDPLGLGVDTSLDSIGFHKLRSGKEAEEHLYDPEAICLLQEACRTGSYETFQRFTAKIQQHDHSLRSKFTLESGLPPVALEEVEPVEAIVKRFKTGAMSYGSISKEAHECMAVAMNTLGGKSNSGEGGEDPERYGTIRNSAIKQVASGRFGVTSAYLNSAKEIQIKMAQGAKPGEGGHLPGSKVYPWIAKTRFSTPGVSLISPPPHHDIYSIEDLAQLIYDLKNANAKARISVKLVSEEGVGTVACGVAKAGAQVILISGYDGGTGAAYQSSIHHAGLPWEIGLANVHRELSESGLRSRVVIETDGKLLSGKDLAAAALLGAEEFGFATGPLVSMGCRMMRVCNLNTCPFGIATQDERLRKHFAGKPEYVMNFMKLMAEDLRHEMARLGFKSVDEMVGRSSCLHQADENGLDFSSLLSKEYPGGHQGAEAGFDPTNTLDGRVLIPAFKPYMKNNPKPHAFKTEIHTTDRTAGTLLGSLITQRYDDALPEDTFTVNLTGAAGQSFGAFAPKGLRLNLTGEANDAFGKGLSGGTLTLRPEAGLVPDENVIVGNVALYGATSGKAFISGLAGERFAVRNSGADVVAEGVGDHGLEYMTGGTALILGPVGRNFAAGMSGGIAYVLDPDHSLYRHMNRDMADLSDDLDKEDEQTIRSLLESHVQATGSPKGKEILAHFASCLSDFKKVVPREWDAIRQKTRAYQSQGYDQTSAALRAFENVRG